MRLGPADRDLELRRVSRLTRWLVAGALGLAGVLSAVVAQALPGASSSGATASSGGASSTASPSSGGAVPTTLPTFTSPVGGGSSVSPSGGSSGLAPSPAPVPTPQRGVARSGAS